MSSKEPVFIKPFFMGVRFYVIYVCFVELLIMKYTPRKLINGKMLCLIPVFQLLHQCSLLQNLVTFLCSS